MTDDPKLDRFDEVPVDAARSGAHRAARAGVRGWMIFAWAALITFVIVAGGSTYILWSSGHLQRILTPTSSPTPTVVPTAEPTISADMAVNILNGTPIAGLGSTVSDFLASQGVKVGVKADASETDVTKTMVFYSKKEDEGAARGVCQALQNTCQIKFTQAYANSSAPLTLVIGADYQQAEPAQ